MIYRLIFVIICATITMAIVTSVGIRGCKDYIMEVDTNGCFRQV